MRKAVIDMGTNTFNLLIADVGADSFRMKYATKEPVLLGMGGINDNRISEEAMARAHLAVKKFMRTCKAFEIVPQNVIAIGTSALRGAANSDEFVSSMMRVFGIDIQIISGEEEANYIFKGVKWTYDFAKRGVIMDIGGGSTEFIAANADGIDEVVSLNIGVSRVYQHFDHPETYSSELQSEILSYFDQCPQAEMTNFKADTLIGASGSFETFYEMIFESEWEAAPKTVELPMNELMRVLDWSIASTQKERNDHVWIAPIRKTMLPIAALQIKWAIEKIGCQRVLISPYSLKEGALH